MTVLQKMIDVVRSNKLKSFSPEEVVTIVQNHYLEEEQQIRDAWSISANRHVLNIDIDTYINQLKERQ